MGQFYYRPVPSGHGAVGRSIAAGITGGVEGYVAGKEAGRRRKVEDEDRTRRREREDLDLDILLASAGGGRGQAPGDDVVGLPSADSALTQARPGLEMPQPAPAPAGRGREYAQMGDFFIEDPTSRATRLEEGTYELGRTRAATDRARRGDVLGGAGAALVGGSRDPDDFAAFYGEGADPLAAVRESRPKAPVRGTPEYEDMLEREAGIAQEYRGQADDPDEVPQLGSIEFNRVYDIVSDMATERSPEGFVTGSSMTDSELIATTQALLRGEDPFAEDALRPDRGALKGYPSETIERIMSSVDPEGRSPATALTSPTSPRRRPARTEPTDTSEATAAPASPDSSRDSIVAAIRKYRTEGLTQEQALARLREDGLIGR